MEQEEKNYPGVDLGEPSADQNTAAPEAAETKPSSDETAAETTAAPMTGAGTAGGKLWRNSKKDTTYRMVVLAVLSALVIVLQLWGSAIQIGGTSLSLVLIPIVIGGLMLGVGGGTFLGALFGLFVLIYCGVAAMDPFTAFLFQQKPVITALICIGKGVVAGAVPPIVYRAARRAFKRELPAVVLASALAPICNTGLFLLGMLTILGTLQTFLNDIMTVGYFIGGIVLVNFSIELAVNIVASPAIYRVLQVVTRKRERG